MGAWTEQNIVRSSHTTEAGVPGTNDNVATIDARRAVASPLGLDGLGELTGHLAAPTGCQIGGGTELLSGAALTTPRLDIAFNEGSDGALVVEERGSVILSGEHGPALFAVTVGAGAGASGTLLVRGPNAVLHGPNKPLCVGEHGEGLLEIRDGGVVSAGDFDPRHLSRAVSIADQPGSAGAVDVARGAFLANGAIFVGHHGIGTLDVGLGGLVTALGMTIGVAREGSGRVGVRGESACLAITGPLTVGREGAAFLAVANHALMSVSDAVAVNGSVALDDGRIMAGSFAIDASGTVAGHGTIAAAAGFINQGMITPDRRLTLIGSMINDGEIMVGADADLDLVGPLGGHGVIALNGGGVASLEAVGCTQTIAFAEPGAILVLQTPRLFRGLVVGFGPGDSIELGCPASGVDFADGVLTIAGRVGMVARVRLVGCYSGRNFRLAAMGGERSVIRCQ